MDIKEILSRRHTEYSHSSVAYACGANGKSAHTKIPMNTSEFKQLHSTYLDLMNLGNYKLANTIFIAMRLAVYSGKTRSKTFSKVKYDAVNNAIKNHFEKMVELNANESKNEQS